MQVPDDLAAIDLDLLRTERLDRLQGAMRAHGLEACLLFSEPNARYATGATAMPIWSMSTFTRCAVVAAEGDPILFEHPNSVHRSALRAKDVRPMHGWEFFDDAAGQARTFAQEAVAALREIGVRGDRPGSVAHRAARATPGCDARARARGVSVVQRAQRPLRDGRDGDAHLEHEHVHAMCGGCRRG